MRSSSARTLSRPTSARPTAGSRPRLDPKRSCGRSSTAWWHALCTSTNLTRRRDSPKNAPAGCQRDRQGRGPERGPENAPSPVWVEGATDSCAPCRAARDLSAQVVPITGRRQAVSDRVRSPESPARTRLVTAKALEPGEKSPGPIGAVSEGSPNSTARTIPGASQSPAGWRALR